MTEKEAIKILADCLVALASNCYYMIGQDMFKRIVDETQKIKAGLDKPKETEQNP